MADYTYQTFDLVTGLILTELPLTTSSLPESLNNFDQAKFNLPINDSTKLPAGWSYALLPGRTGIVALRNTSVIWAGIIWDINTANGGQALDLSCTTVVGFFAYQTLDVDTPFVQVDQHTIARTLGQYVATQPGGNLNIAWGTDLSGILRDRTEYYGVEHKSIFDLWRQLAGVVNGIDFRVTTIKSSGSQVQHTFQVGSPLGLGPDISGLIFDYTDEPNAAGSGNIDSYAVARPGFTTAVWVIGAGEGVDMVQTLVENTALLNSGFPRVVKVLSKKSVSDVSILQDYGNAELSMAGDFMPQVTLLGSVYPQIGTYSVGDFCQLRITSPEFPRQADGTPGLVLTARIYSRDTDPNTDRVKLTLQPLDNVEEQ